MSAPFGQPTYAQLAQQVADLTKQAGKPLTLDDLPLGDLRSALIENGPPLDLSVLSLNQTVGYDLLNPLAIQRVTVLPSAPRDGDIIRYVADATNGIVWLLEYNGTDASTHKWRYIGGPPLIVGFWPGLVSGETITSATYAALPTNPQLITIPLAGDYSLALSATMDAPAPDDGTIVSLAFKRGTAATSDADAINVRDNALTSVSANFKLNGSAAGDVIALQAKSGTSGSRIFNRALQIAPVRVG